MNSPCKKCKKWSTIFPICLKKCTLIHKFQDFLINGYQDYKIQNVEVEKSKINITGYSRKRHL